MFCPVETVRTEAQTCRTFMRAHTNVDVFFILVLGFLFATFLCAKGCNRANAIISDGNLGLRPIAVSNVSVTP
jgi:hypothetical protein